MLSAESIKFGWTEGLQFSFPDLNVSAGEQWLMLGASGSGKTTYLHILAGLLKPKSGQLKWDQQEIVSMSSAQLDLLRGSLIGLVFQQPHLLRSLNVRDNLRLAMKLAGERPDDQIIERTLSRLSISEKLKSKVHRLSQGEQQRVAVARALVGKPKLLLADEPTASLDDANCAEVANLLQELAQEHKTALLIVTHDQRLKDRFTNRITL